MFYQDEDVSTQQLNQFVNQLESEVGYSGRTLYQVLSEYLVLKSRFPELCWDVEGLEIPSADQMSLSQFQNNRDLLGTYQKSRRQILECLEAMNIRSLDQHPWKYLGHVDHQKEEFDALLRTLRILSIQLNKFWVELQSCPLFFNSLNHSSLDQIEEILLWIQSSPSWLELNQQGRLIPALINSTSRKALLEFRRDVKSVRVLKDRLKSQVESYSDQSTLRSAWETIQRHQLNSCLKLDLEKRIERTTETLEKVQKILDFSTSIHHKSGFPSAPIFAEARHMIKALKKVREVPEEVLSWRRPQILASGQALRLKAWDERARPIRELRAKLASHFKMDLIDDPEKLRDLSEGLIGGGLFRRFKFEYKNAERSYSELLLDPLKSPGGAKAAPLEKSQWLLNWASYLEQIKAFENNSDLINVFGPLFKGVDTLFDAALRANTWCSQMRQDLQSNSFGKAVVDFFCSASEDQFQKMIQVSQESDLIEMERNLMDLSEFQDQRLKDWIQDEETKLNELKGLLKMLDQIKLRSDLSMTSLEDVLLMSEELSFLESQMDSNSDLRIWLKNIFAGSDTDITLIDRGLSYVRFIEEAPIPESMRISFLSLHGPQRFNESQNMIHSILSTLSPLKEHLQKLESVTYGQVVPLKEGPILQLMTQIQEALKHSSILEEWVDYLQLEKEVRGRGLGVVIDFFEGKPDTSVQLDLAYEMALDASVLKKKMTGNLFQDISMQSIGLS